MKHVDEKQYIIFLDYEPYVSYGQFAIYIVDRVNKMYFRIGQRYIIDCVKNIKELLEEYEIERIEMYCLDCKLHWLKCDLEISTKTPIGLAYEVRSFRDKLRHERNPIRRNTQPAFYYEYSRGYKITSKEEYDSHNYDKSVYRCKYIDFEWK